MKHTSYAFALAHLLSLVSAHGQITSPKPRAAGPAMAAACGQQMFSQQTSDAHGNIQGELQTTTQANSGYNAAACNIWTCKGFKYADNTANVQKYAVGDVVPIKFDILAPHTGVANVSIVTSDGALVKGPLISWDVFASNSVPVQADQTSFQITIPAVGDACAKEGNCVIQHFWDARSIDQTYESCIDVVIGGGGSSPPASSSGALSSSSSAVSNSTANQALSTPSASQTPSGSALPVAVNSTSTKPSCNKAHTGKAALPNVPSTPTTLSTVTVASPSPAPAPDTAGSSTDSGKKESDTSGSKKASSGVTGSDTTGSKKTSSETTGSDTKGSGTTGSGNTGSGNTGSGNTSSGNTGSGNTGSGNTNPDTTGSSTPSSAGTNPGPSGADANTINELITLLKELLSKLTSNTGS